MSGARTRRRGFSFLDFLIILAIVLLLAALAIPRFRKAPDYGDEADEIGDATKASGTNQPVAGEGAEIPDDAF